MRIRFRHTSVALFFLIALANRSGPVSAQWPPDSITNLQVLSKDLPFDSLVGIMAGFTRALGVRCSTCHMGEESQPIGEYDFASDDKPLKRKARAMLEMVQAINGRHLANLEARVQPSLNVDCFTCHRGAREPRRLQDVLVAAWQAGGTDSVVTAYNALRSRYYGSAVFSFDEVALADVSDFVETSGALRDALRLDSLNLAVNPTSSFARRLHAARALHVAYAESDSAGARRFDELLAAPGADVFTESLVNQLGMGLLRRNLHSAAVDVLRRNAERHPRSAAAQTALGQAWAAAGNVEEAIRCFERALAIDPDHAPAARQLRELRGRQESPSAARVSSR